MVVIIVLTALTLGGLTYYRACAQVSTDRENYRLQREAAGRRSPEEMGRMILDAQAAELGLTESQKQRFGEAQRRTFGST